MRLGFPNEAATMGCESPDDNEPRDGTDHPDEQAGMSPFEPKCSGAIFHWWLLTTQKRQRKIVHAGTQFIPKVVGMRNC